MTTSRLPNRVRATAPGSIGNIGPGLDILGCAVTGLRDAVEASWGAPGAAPGIEIADSGNPELPTDPSQHSSAIAARAVLDAVGVHDRAVVLRIRKELPLSGGQGGSAASAVAGAVAMNALLGGPLSPDALLTASLAAEERVAGRHADNLAPALLGGIVLVRSLDPIDLVRLPVPASLRIVLVHPAQRLRTADSRAVLPSTIDLALALAQAAQIAAMVAAFAAGDLALLRRALDDRIAEPARAALLPGFSEAKAAALSAGALGCSISGSGPTSFAFAGSDADAATIARAMCDGYGSRGVSAAARIARIDTHGAQVERLLESDPLPSVSR